jgi:polysaccharide export outer membrane protein
MRYVLLLLGLLVFGMAAGWAQAMAPAYRLGPEDVITVTVQRHPEYSGEYLIPPDGVLELPVCGKVPVGGMTVQELAVLVTRRLGERLLKPEVVVALKAPRMQRIYVMGGVTQPGVYDVKPGWRVLEAVTAAGGVMNGGKLDAVILVRQHDGKEQRLTCNLERFVKTADVTQNPPVTPGDVIYVPTQHHIDWQQVLAVVSIIGLAAGVRR